MFLFECSFMYSEIVNVIKDPMCNFFHKFIRLETQRLEVSLQELLAIFGCAIINLKHALKQKNHDS